MVLGFYTISLSTEPGRAPCLVEQAVPAALEARAFSSRGVAQPNRALLDQFLQAAS
jgi:hypothetical protein